MEHDAKSLNGNWNYPTTIRFGCGRISELADACQSLGIKRPLLVTDTGLANHSMITDSIITTQAAGLATELFSDVKANPNSDNIMAGVMQYLNDQHDGIIAFGGGSALDAGKAIALMAGQTRPLWDFEDVGNNWQRANSDGIAPIIAIPTTSGTGSEVGRASVIVDDSTQSKKIIFHPKMLPAIVIADPELTVGLPANITAATGMDALSHNLEAYCSAAYHPMADGIALEGMRLIKDWLPIACQEPANLPARSHMMIASSMGATAFQKGLGAMHALAHPLGALYDAHHGLLNAILMPYVLIRNRPAINEKMAHLARCLQLDEPSFDGLLNFILALRNQIGIPADLKSIGIDETHQQKIGNMAAIDPSASGNPVGLTPNEYTILFSCAVNGTLP